MPSPEDEVVIYEADSQLVRSFRKLARRNSRVSVQLSVTATGEPTHKVSAPRRIFESIWRLRLRNSGMQ